MYKQTIWGIKKPVISVIFAVLLTLFYLSFLESVYKTDYATIRYYVLSFILYAMGIFYLYIVTVTRYEYAVLDNELIIRKFHNKRSMRIFSVKLVRSNCVYYKRGTHSYVGFGKNTYHMYMPLMQFFSPKCVIVFTDSNGERIKISFKPDENLDKEVYRIKTTNW